MLSNTYVWHLQMFTKFKYLFNGFPGLERRFFIERFTFFCCRSIFDWKDIFTVLCCLFLTIYLLTMISRNFPSCQFPSNFSTDRRLCELSMFWLRRAFVESDSFAGVSMFLLMFCFFAKLSVWASRRWTFFFQFIKSQNIAKRSTAAPSALPAAVFSTSVLLLQTEAGIDSS